MHYEQESGKTVTSLRNCFPKAFLASGLSIEITAIPAQNTKKKNINRDKTNHWQQCYKSFWMKNVPILYNYEYIKITITWIMNISSINFSNANIKWTSLSWTISMILTVSYLHDLCLMPRLLKKYEIVKNVWKVLCLDFEPLIAV